jgi:hypothetical protein
MKSPSIDFGGFGCLHIPAIKDKNGATHLHLHLTSRLLPYDQLLAANGLNLITLFG